MGGGNIGYGGDMNAIGGFYSRESAY